MKTAFTYIKHAALALFMTLFSGVTFAQGLEDVIVEVYNTADAATAGADANLSEGAVTYRVFIDMAAGYEFQAVYGGSNSPAKIETTTEWYNHPTVGTDKAESVFGAVFAQFPSLALDSWVSVGAGSNMHLGIPKTDDPDGSILTMPDLTSADGLTAGTPPATTPVGVDISMFANTNSSTNFNTTNGSWASLAGSTGATADNRVLIGQFTTTGDFSFALNVQIRNTANGSVENYVASNPKSSEVQFPKLNYPDVVIAGCMDPLACNYNINATEDDGSCLLPVENCYECDGQELKIIDSDGDGICNEEEIIGCMEPTACNYNPDATDEGSCIEALKGCSECNETGDGLVIIDTDGDGICDLEDDTGCTNDSACNYNPYATNDDGSCLIPFENCWECDGTELVIIDSDNDGICDAEDIVGCTSPTACNYNKDAKQDDGSCIEPIEDCQECNENNDGLVIVDTDGDGICDAEEIKGCMDPTACNYDSLATDNDDEGCLIPVEDCWECNEDSTRLVMIDSDNDGICDSEDTPDILGCTNRRACNYNPEANKDDGSCLVPVDYCTYCSEDSTSLILIDSDGDGICDADEEGVEEILVEVYYVSDSADATDTDGGTLNQGSVTYRVYVDMVPHKELQSIYGVPESEMFIETSTFFFNHEDRGEIAGDKINSKRLDEGTVGLDSWISIGGASSKHLGVIKSDDQNGSIIGGSNNDGGSESIEGGLLTNATPSIGIPLTTSDGMADGTPLATNFIGDIQSKADVSFGNSNSTDRFASDNGSWYVLGGARGADSTNRVLIGQFTTDGLFSFNLNVQVRDTLVEGTSPNVSQFEGLAYEAIPGCTNPEACNYNSKATIDNGMCLLPVEDCWECDGDKLVIVDTDGDGICDAEDDPTSISKPIVNTELSISPNPVVNELNMEIQSLDTPLRAQFTITDITGKDLVVKELGVVTSTRTERVNMAQYARGIYFLSVQYDNGTTVCKKIIKE